MDPTQAERYINDLKQRWDSSGRQFYRFDVRWCKDHTPLPDKLGGYTAWPVIKDPDSIVGYMNEHGFAMNSDGIPCHPLADVLGLSKQHLSS